MVEYCYIFNVLTWLQTLACPTCEIWMKINYVLAMGPVSFTIVSWQQGVVFHSANKVTSVLMHALPGI